MALDKFLTTFNIDRKSFVQEYWTDEPPCMCSKPAEEPTGLDRKHHTSHRVYFEFKRYAMQYCVTLLGPTTVPFLDNVNIALYDETCCTTAYIVTEYDCPNYGGRHLNSTPLIAVRAKHTPIKDQSSTAQPPTSSAARRMLNAAMRYIA